MERCYMPDGYRMFFSLLLIPLIYQLMHQRMTIQMLYNSNTDFLFGRRDMPRLICKNDVEVARSAKLCCNSQPYCTAAGVNKLLACNHRH